MKNTLMFCTEDVSSTSSFYRGIVPLSKIKQKTNLQVYIPSRITWAEMQLADAVYLLRPHTDNDLKIASIAKSAGKPIWVDYDDLFWDMEQSHPAYSLFSTPAFMDRLTRIVGMADIVTVSTEFLKERLGHKNCLVIPNAMPPDMFPTDSDKERSKTVLWRGSVTHEIDLAQVETQVADLIKEFDQYQFIFMGFFPKNIQRMIGEYRRVGFMNHVDVYEYFSTIRQILPKLVICPLKGTNFNRAKSNIGWLEASYAGAHILAPDLEEWKKPGIINYKVDNADDFFNKAHEVLSQKFDFEKFKLSREYIFDNLLFDQVNIERMGIMSDLGMQIKMSDTGPFMLSTENTDHEGIEGFSPYHLGI